MSKHQPHEEIRGLLSESEIQAWNRIVLAAQQRELEEAQMQGRKPRTRVVVDNGVYRLDRAPVITAQAS